MTMEALSSILKKVMERGFNQGFLASRRGDVGTVVSHLLFVDDTLISCDSNKEHLEALSWMFMWFEVISGLKINLDKSELISMEKVDNTKDLARVARCKVDSLPSTYLGLPLGASFKYAQTWDIQEASKRLPSEGRRVPKKTLPSENRLIVGLDKKDGGLGVRKLSALNMAFLGKWCWRFAYENESPWNQAIVGKYNEEERGW
ncbi:hypothetical protein CK203_039228 [Vitis vinifera]|uniref:Reverse transcriptase domain-containing protein n=1 Tax=Vitis vinifera TaxID=29760 RepID=A0A438H6Z5_VITVI|nr:hypothetical protein CK203_039228 [Vitis vinifera]